MHRRSIGTRTSLDGGPREGGFFPQFRICARERRSQHGDGTAVARAGINQLSILDPLNCDKDAIVSENLGSLKCKLFGCSELDVTDFRQILDVDVYSFLRIPRAVPL